VAWTWLTTHPGGHSKSIPGPQIRDMLGRLNCTEVRRTGRYPSHDAEFDAFYFYKDPNEHTELLTSLGRFAMLAALVMVVLGWAHVAELWDRKGTSVAVIFTSFLAAYAHNDLSSAFGDQLSQDTPSPLYSPSISTSQLFCRFVFCGHVLCHSFEIAS
jgi:hypothetical protein